MECGEEEAGSCGRTRSNKWIALRGLRQGAGHEGASTAAGRQLAILELSRRRDGDAYGIMDTGASVRMSCLGALG